MDSADIETRLREVLASRTDEIVAAYLFGSRGRGTAREGSDADVGVLFVDRPSATLDSADRALEAELERAAGCAVQVVSLETAPPDLAMRVLRDGRLLLEGDRSARIRFEVRTRNLFFDIEPVLRRYRRAEAAG